MTSFILVTCVSFLCCFYVCIGKIVVFRRDWKIITIFWISILLCSKRVIWEIRTEFCVWWCQREGNNGEPEGGCCFVQGTNKAAYLLRTLFVLEKVERHQDQRGRQDEGIDKKRCIPFLDGTRNNISEIYMYMSREDVFICLKSHQLLDNLRFSIPNK